MVTTKNTEQEYFTGVNTWRLSGSVLKKKVQFSQNGKMWGTLYINIPAKNAKYSTKLFLKFFQDNGIAEKVEQSVNEGENYMFFGYFQNNKPYEKDGKMIYGTDYVITKIFPAKEKPVDTENKAGNTETKTEQSPSEDSVPF